MYKNEVISVYRHSLATTKPPLLTERLIKTLLLR